MKTICQKSGINIWKSDLLMGFDLADEHPIFKAKTNLILNKNMVHRFMFAENPEEKKLIFLATLHASYLVEFTYPANPSLKTMEKYFHQMQRLVEWVRFAEWKLAKIVSFPQYIIRKDNANLDNIGSWLNSLEELREKINKRELERDKSAALHQREMEIKRELGEANFAGKAFTPKLAKWSLDLCDITLHHADYNKWMKIMCLPLSEAWIADYADYVELEDLLSRNLPILEENPQAISVMHQMRTLMKECRRGFTEFTMFADENQSEVSDFEILEDGSQITKMHKINQHLKDVPTEEPIKGNYPTKVAYLLAKAKWDLNKKHRDNPPEPEEPTEENTRPKPPNPPTPVSEESV